MSNRTVASLSTVLDLLLDAVCIVDEEGRYVYVSAAFEQVFGYAPQEIMGRRMIELVHPDDRERTLAAARNVMAGNSHLHFENRYIRKDGQIVHIMWSARWSEEDRLRIAVARDITEKKQAEALQQAVFAISEAAHSTDTLQALLPRIHQIIHTLMPADSFAIALQDTGELLDLRYNAEADTAPAAEGRATAAFATQVIHGATPLLISPLADDTTPEATRAVADSTAICWVGVPFHSSRGITGALVLKSYSQSCHYTRRHLEILQYVSTQVATAIERKQLYERLQHLAQYDELTDLPNRTLLQDRLDHAIAKAARDGTSLVVMFVDLDQFKSVNDTLGHAAGDLLLQQVAARLRTCVRTSDTVGRLSGDEFIIILENISAEDLPTAARAVSSKIESALSTPFKLGTDITRISASIGTACYPEDGTTTRQLFKQADAAMYRLKKVTQSL